MCLRYHPLSHIVSMLHTNVLHVLNRTTDSLQHLYLDRSHVEKQLNTAILMCK